MATSLTIERTTESLQLPHARLTGVFYVLTIVLGMSAEMMHGKIIVANDAASTVTNILTHPDLFRLSTAANLLGDACYIVVTALLYHLLKPVSRSVSLTAAFMSLVGCAMGAVSCALEAIPSMLLGGASFTTVLSVDQTQVLAYTFLRAGGQAYRTGMVFFGFYCILIGYLVFRSSFMPRFVGILMALAGLGWLTFLWPPLTKSLGSALLLTGLIGEGSITLWLLLLGVNVERWREQATRSF